MDNNSFQCHKHQLLKAYRLGKPWRPLHYPPLPSSSQSDGHLFFEFCWQTTHRYFNLVDQTPINPHLIQTVKESEGVVSISVDRLAFLKEDAYARGLVDSLIPNSNSPPGDFEANWLVSSARIFLQAHPHLEALLIGLEVVRYHLCFESLLVRNVMEQSFEEMSLQSKPASESSLELLKSVDFDETSIDGLPNCVVCQEELFLCKEKEVLDMPCSHMFHGDCILKWLQNSHFCPICRFKMPTT